MNVIIILILLYLNETQCNFFQAEDIFVYTNWKPPWVQSLIAGI